MLSMSATASAQSARLQRAAGDDDCAICLAPLSAQPCLRLAGCNHVLHLDCYLAFTQHDSDRGAVSRCPLCRAMLIVEQKIEGTGVFAVQSPPGRVASGGSIDSQRNVMAECLTRWARERQEYQEMVPATHRAREQRVRALEATYGLSNATSESSRAWRHAASHAALLAGPGEDPAGAALQGVATELQQRRDEQQRTERDGMGRDLARQRRERELDKQALQANEARQRKRKETERLEAEQERKRLREQIAADRLKRRS